MTNWHAITETPKEGAKIEYVISRHVVEVDTWQNGGLTLSPDDWHYVRVWRYVDEDYLDKEDK